ncbi:MAG: hypothetical protein HY549_01595 [Elusimicrobia bacterium]|nr:hypothetical protein [Elusimicrobiota bacterium]
MRKDSEKAHDVVVTSKEALNLLGIRKGALISLEQAAKVQRVPKRDGYTDKELKRLLVKLRKILRR